MKRETYAAAAMIWSVVSSVPVHAARFAIHCQGTSNDSSTLFAMQETKGKPLPTQIYVIDEDKKWIARALVPRQQFEDLCDAMADCQVDISPGLILLRATGRQFGVRVSKSMEIDRASGKTSHKLSLDWPDGRYDRSDWYMTCRPGPIPIFDPSKNKF